MEFGNFLSGYGKFSTSLPRLTRARFRRVMGSGHGATRSGGDMSLARTQAQSHRPGDGTLLKIVK